MLGRRREDGRRCTYSRILKLHSIWLSFLSLFLACLTWNNIQFLNNRSLDFDDRFGPLQTLVEEGDLVYSSKWDAPIVLDQYKLIFFYAPKVACTGFKLLFHRMMGVNTAGWRFERIHDPRWNELKYLYDYSLEQANRMMQDPTWTRAMFVRNPHEKLVSAYLEKGVGTNFSYVRNVCCKKLRNCMNGRSQNFPSFVDLIAAQGCFNGHWGPQSARLEGKTFPYINFIGHFESLEEDGRSLLERVGAWEEHGKTGWGPNGTASVFSLEAAGISRRHATKASDNLNKFYTSRDVFELVTEYYEVDYNNPFLNLSFVEPADLKKNGPNFEANGPEKKYEDILSLRQRLKSIGKKNKPGRPVSMKGSFKFHGRDKRRISDAWMKRRKLIGRISRAWASFKDFVLCSTCLAS